MVKKAAVLLSFVTLLSGCATEPTWKKTGVSHDDSVSALSECKYQVGVNKVEKSEQRDLVKECMQSKGFRWRAE